MRWLAVLAALIVVAPSLAPWPADARVGGGQNTGSRGTRTNQAPPPTQTAPATKPIERTTTPQTPAATAPAAQRGGFMARNPFLSGLMGGMLGAGLFGMLFGGGFFGGLGGGAAMLGLLVQAALIGGLVYLGIRLWRGRAAVPASPVYAYAGPAALQAPADAPAARSGAALLGGGSVGLAITEADYNSFESLLSGIQGAYSDGDLGKMRSLVTPEMLGYFSEQLSGNASRGIENKVAAVKLEQGDLAEAWSEGGVDYATVAMRFSMIDATRRIADGSIVEGSATERAEATEVWTFLRSRGGQWNLSAIQQA